VLLDGLLAYEAFRVAELLSSLLCRVSCQECLCYGHVFLVLGSSLVS
jgi:hypothetical protein